GMSGAGRSTALHVLEDLGFFCVDNLPLPLAPAALERVAAEPGMRRVGLGVDVRMGAFLEGAEEILSSIEAAGHDLEVLFIDCGEEALVRRFSESRRPHPLAPGGDLLGAIRRERERVGPLRARATKIVDTTELTVHELRRLLVEYVARQPSRSRMITRIISFGFKYGVPVDADLVFDLRYLPNPHFVPELRPLTGEDRAVSDFVLAHAEATDLLERLTELLSYLIPRYEREGKAYLTVAMGCTGGRHRSVTFALALAERLESLASAEIVVSHRDSGRA
ncbi:MAG: RNase adapter RapZ, partial [Myxococcales bacterium]|nr:RNase adapter RapZ [Myxococcales bacterium]